MGKDDGALLSELKQLTRGLLFQSESDYPVVPFLQPSAGKDAASAQDFVSAKKVDAKATVSEVGFDQFFGPATQEQSWQDADARRRVKKFQALVKSLKDNLSDLHVFKVGDTEMDVYVVGRTAAGSLAGVTTKVVET